MTTDTDTKPAEETTPDFPEGQYARVELMGHRTLWGRISEVTCFGAAMLKIEPIVGGKIVSDGEVLTGAGSIYCLTKVTPAIAFAHAPAQPGYGDNTLRLIAPPAQGLDLDAVPDVRPAPPRHSDDANDDADDEHHYDDDDEHLF